MSGTKNAEDPPQKFKEYQLQALLSSYEVEMH